MVANPTTNYQKAIANLVPGTTYAFRVRAINELGQQSDWSESLIYTVPLQTTAPTNVTGIQVVAQSLSFIVSWQANIEPDIDHYELYSGSTANFVPDTTTYTNRIYDGPASVFVYPAVEGQNYWFCLRAVNTSGVASPFTANAGPYAVTGVAATLGDGSVIGGSTIVGNTIQGGTIVGAQFDITSSAQSGITFQGTGNITWQSGSTGGIVVPNAQGYIRSADYTPTSAGGWNLDGQTGLTFNSSPWILSINPYNQKVIRFYEPLGGGAYADSFYINNQGQAFFAQGVIQGGSANIVINSSFESFSTQSLTAVGTHTGTAADFWGIYQGGAGTVSVAYGPSSTNVIDGVYAQEFSWSGNSNHVNIGLYANLSLPAGQNVWPANTTWTISWWATETGSSGNTAFQLLSDSPSGITDTWVIKPTPSTTTPQRYVVNRKIGTSNATSYLYLVSNNSSDTVYIDAVQVEQGSVATPYGPRPGEVLSLGIGPVSGGKSTFNVDNLGNVVANSINITGGQFNIGSGTASFHVDQSGNMWLGNATFSSAPFNVNNQGAVNASNITITGGSLNITGASGTVTISSTGGFQSSNATITGGALNIGGGTFQVNTSGAVTASNISVTGGAINLGNGTFQVTNSGAVTASNLSVSGGSIALGAGSASFHVDSAGNLWLGSATIGSAPFSVTNGGAVTASNLTLTGGSITTGSGAHSFNVDGSGNIWSGSSSFGTAPFSVSNTGALAASNVTITGGSLNITNGTNTFSVTATGVVSANNATITGGSLNIGGGTFTVSTSGAVSASSLSITGGSINLGSGVFQVTNTGAVTASNITITGGSFTLGSGSTSFHVDSSGNMWLGSSTLAGAPFSATNAGAVTANNVTITGGSFTLGSGATSFHVDASGNLWVGATTQGAAPFQVTNAGAVTASNIAVTGGSFAIGSGNTSMHVDSSGNLWLGNAVMSNAPFQVSNTGAVTASNLTVNGGTITGPQIVVNNSGYIQSGNYTATSGWKIDPNGYTFNNGNYTFSINPTQTEIVRYYYTGAGNAQTDIFFLNSSGQAYFSQGTIVGGGANYVTNSSFEAFSGLAGMSGGAQSLTALGGTGATGSVADYWGSYQNTTGTGIAVTYSRSAQYVVAGQYAQRWSWSGNSTNKNIGVYANISLPNGTNIWPGGTQWMISWWATETGTGGVTGFQLVNDDTVDIVDTWVIKPTPSATAPQRYVVSRSINGSGATPSNYTSKFYIASNATADTITIDAVQVEQSKVATPYLNKGGEVLSLQVGANAATSFNVDFQGDVWTGSSTFSNAPWRVDYQGNQTTNSITITGGSINIGGASSFHVDTSGNFWTGAASIGSAPFAVTSAGQVTATNINITGLGTSGINVGSGAFTVSNTGAVVASNLTLTGGSFTIGSGAASLRIDVSGNLWSGSSSTTFTTTAPFAVSNAGAVNASNLTVTGGSLSIGTGNSIFKVDSSGNHWAGNAVMASAPFQVTNGGAVTASNVTITGGSLSINSAFTVTSAGAVTMTSLSGTGISIGSGAFSVTNAGAVTASNITVTGGSLTIGSSFSVTTGGVLTATGASITGTVNITAGSFFINKGTSTSFNVDTSGNFWIGSTSTTFTTAAPFAVDHAGNAYASSLTMTGGSLSVGTGNNIFKVDSSGNHWAGNATMASAPFQVTYGGAVTATNIQITGLGSGGININSGAFSVTSAGAVTASNLTITGLGTSGINVGGGTFTVSQTGAVAASNLSITGGSITVGAGNNIFKVDSSGNLWSGNAVMANAPFQVTYAGAVTASSLSITGTSSNITGTLSVGGNIQSSNYGATSGWQLSSSGYLFNTPNYTFSINPNNTKVVDFYNRNTGGDIFYINNSGQAFFSQGVIGLQGGGGGANYVGNSSFEGSNGYSLAAIGSSTGVSGTIADNWGAVNTKSVTIAYSLSSTVGVTAGSYSQQFSWSGNSSNGIIGLYTNLSLPQGTNVWPAGSQWMISWWATETGSGGQTALQILNGDSRWYTSSDTWVSYPTPSPTIPQRYVISRTISAASNLFTAASASFEGSLGTWTGVYNAILTDVSGTSLDGSYSMKMSASDSKSGGNVMVSANTGFSHNTGTPNVSVTGNSSYVIIGATKSNPVVGRTFGIAADWYSAPGTNISTSSFGYTINPNNANAFSYMVVKVTAPSNATLADVQVASANSSYPRGSLSAPSPTISTATTGGSIAASTTRYYKVTTVNEFGETTASSEVSITTGSGTSTNANTLKWTAPLAQGQTDPSYNLIYDAGFVHAADANGPTWSATGTVTYGSGNTYYTGTGAASGFTYPQSQVIQLAPFNQYTYEVTSTVPAATSGSLNSSIFGANVVVSLGSTLSLAPGDSSTRHYGTFTCPSGTYVTVFDAPGGLSTFMPLNSAPYASGSAVSGWSGSTWSAATSSGSSASGYSQENSVYLSGTPYASGPLWLGQTNGFMMSAWVYIAGSTHGACMYNGTSTAGVGWGIGSGTYATAGTNVIVNYQGVRTIDTGKSLTANTWHHVAVYISSSGLATVYVDGTQAYTEASGTGPSAPTGGLAYIGTDPSSTSTKTFTGYLSFAAVANNVSSQTANCWNGSKWYQNVWNSQSNGPYVRVLPFDTVNVTVPSGQQVVVTNPQLYYNPSGSTTAASRSNPLYTYKVYASTTSGNEQYQGTSSNLAYVDTVATLASGATVPSLNTTPEYHYFDNFGMFAGDTLGYPLTVLADQPLGYWALNDNQYFINTNNGVPSTIGGASLTLSNSIVGAQPGPVAADASQTSIKFQNSGALTAPTALVAGAQSALSIEFCFKTTGTNFALVNYLDNSGSNYLASSVNSSGQLTTTTMQQGSYVTLTTSSAFNDGNWHHVVITSTPGGAANSLNIYVDGTVAATGAGPATAWNFSASTNYVEICVLYGGSLVGSTPVYLAHVAIYGYALTAAKVSAHATARTNTSGNIVQKWIPGGFTGITSAFAIVSSNTADTVTVDAVQVEQGSVATPWHAKPNEFLSLSVGSGANTFNVDGQGNIWSGATTFAAAPFSVLNTGSLTATSANFTGATINTNGAIVTGGAFNVVNMTASNFYTNETIGGTVYQAGVLTSSYSGSGPTLNYWTQWTGPNVGAGQYIQQENKNGNITVSAYPGSLYLNTYLGTVIEGGAGAAYTLTVTGASSFQNSIAGTTISTTGQISSTSTVYAFYSTSGAVQGGDIRSTNGNILSNTAVGYLDSTNSNGIIQAQTFQANGGSLGNSAIVYPQGIPALSGGLQVVIVPSSQELGVPSSLRENKMNIRDLATTMLDNPIYKLRPRVFEYNIATWGNQHKPDWFEYEPGFIVDEMEHLMPQAMSRDANGRAIYYNQAALITYLTAAVQELKARVDELEGKK